MRATGRPTVAFRFWPPLAFSSPTWSTFGSAISRMKLVPVRVDFAVRGRLPREEAGKDVAEDVPISTFAFVVAASPLNGVARPFSVARLVQLLRRTGIREDEVDQERLVLAHVVVLEEGSSRRGVALAE